MNISKDWKEVYLLGLLAVIISEAILVISIAGTFLWPYAPGNMPVEELFSLLQDHPLKAFLSLDLLLLLGNIAGIFLIISLYVSLKNISPSWALIAMVLGISALILIIPARPIAELAALSGKYAETTSEVLKNRYLVSGETLLAVFNGISWMANTFLGGLSLLISSVLMRKHSYFGKAAAWVGIVSNLFVCLFFIPFLGLYLLMLSVPGYMVWYYLIGKGLLGMWKESKQ